MKHTLMLLILLLGGALMPAAIHQYYSFSQQPGSYVPIQGTVLTALAADDALSAGIPIGFSFPYGTVNYSQVKISSNGWLGLGIAASAPQIMNELVGYWVNWSTIAPLWDDISLVGGSCQYLTDGLAPNRVFKVQYTDARWIYSAANQFSFQIWLHENGDIEFIYGPSTGDPQSPSASIGINMLPHTSENFLSVTPGNPATVSYLTEDNLVSQFPGNGVKYVFTATPTLYNDLKAVSVSGNSTPTQGSESIYSVNVQNRGLNPQSDYSVALKSGTTLLASVPGPQIASGASIDVSVPWIPSASGPLSIYGSVMLASDEVPSNDDSPALDLNVQPAGNTLITVGDGDDLDNIPFNLAMRNSLYQTLYYAAELNIAGAITGITLSNDFVSNLQDIPVSIWMKNTELNSLENDWIAASDMDLVFSGPIDLPAGSHSIYIPLDDPFIYTGANLALLFHRPWDNLFYDEQDRFRCQSDDQDRSRYTFSDDDVLSPMNLPEYDYELSGVFPYTSFHFEPSGPAPQISIRPSALNFDLGLLGSTQSRNLRIYNLGSAPLGITNISITGSPYFSLAGIPTLPASIGAMQFIQISCQYIPLAEGTHSATILITDNQARQIHSVMVEGSAVDTTISILPHLQTFDQLNIPDLPLNWSKLITPQGSGADVVTGSGGANSEPNYAMLINQVSIAADVYLIAPQLAPEIDLSSLRVKFYARGFFANSSIKVGVMVDPLDQSSFTELRMQGLNGNWTEYIVDLSAYTGPGRFIAFKHGNGVNFETLHIDDVTIEYTPITDLAAISISGSATPSVGIASPYSVTIYNYGTEGVSDYTVKLFTQSDVEIATLDGQYIEAGGTFQAVFSWTPAIQGPSFLYGRVITADDANQFNDQSPALYVLVHPAGSLIVTIGSSEEPGHVPLNLTYNSGLYETIFPSTELNFTGAINAISFYNDFETAVMATPVNIWLGITQAADMAATWIPSTQLQQVFSGVVDFPAGENFISLSLPVPFIYDSAEGHLAMLVQRPMVAEVISTDSYFGCQNLGIGRSRYAWSYQTALDPADPPQTDYTLSGLIPRTSFSVSPIGQGQLTGTVYGPANQTLANASVTIPGVGQTFTNDQGQYLFDSLLATSHQATVAKPGYFDQTQDVTIIQDQIVTLDFVLNPLPTVSVTGMVMGSDNPTAGLANALVSLSDYADFSTLTDSTGHFVLPGVYIDHSYSVSISKPSYQSYTGTLELGTQDLDLGTVTLAELALMPEAVNAQMAVDPYRVELSWLPPDPEADKNFLNKSLAREDRERSLLGYRVYRLLEGQEQYQQYWVLLTQALTSELSLTDYNISLLNNGLYRWAVQAAYSNELFSEPALSNSLLHQQQASGIISGVVRTGGNQPVPGALISAGVFSTTTFANGYYSLPATVGTYEVSCQATGYGTVSNPGIVVTQGQTTTCNFIITVDLEPELQLAPTALIGNYPNPFNPHTTISYSVKTRQHVELAIYNLKGQLVKILLDEPVDAGYHSYRWDGRDAQGRSVSSGIYYCRMRCSDISAMRSMLLLK